MNGQELATAAQYGADLLVILVDNGSYGTIRMHQEREYPERISATELKQSRLRGACARLRRLGRDGRDDRGFRAGARRGAEAQGHSPAPLQDRRRADQQRDDDFEAAREGEEADRAHRLSDQSDHEGHRDKPGGAALPEPLLCASSRSASMAASIRVRACSTRSTSSRRPRGSFVVLRLAASPSAVAASRRSATTRPISNACGLRPKRAALGSVAASWRARGLARGRSAIEGARLETERRSRSAAALPLVRLSGSAAVQRRALRPSLVREAPRLIGFAGLAPRAFEQFVIDVRVFALAPSCSASAGFASIIGGNARPARRNGRRSCPSFSLPLCGIAVAPRQISRACMRTYVPAWGFAPEIIVQYEEIGGFKAPALFIAPALLADQRHEPDRARYPAGQRPVLGLVTLISSCTAPGSPTGMTIRPPGASCSTSGRGTWLPLAAARIAS